MLSARFGYALADQVVYSFGNMVVAALVSRHCAQDQFGVYILTQRAMDVLIQTANVFLWAPLTFNLAALPEAERRRYEASTLTLQLSLCVLSTGLLWALALWSAVVSRSDFYQVFAPLTAAAAGILFREFTRRMYFAQMRFEEAFWTDVATVLLQSACVEWLYLGGRLNVPNVLYVLCGGAVAVSVWWLIRDARYVRPRLDDLARDLRTNLQLGRWFLGSNMVFLASSQCNPWILGAKLGGASVGSYAVCESVVNIPRVALTSMQNVMGPMMAEAQARGGRHEVAKVVGRMDRMLLVASAGVGVAVWACGPGVARLIFRAAPGNARTILAFLSLNLVVYACALAQSYGLTALGRVDTTLYANALGLAVQGLVCVALVHAFGVPGAAAAMLLGNVGVLIARQMFYRREVAAA